jgi:hypothetical protein
MPPVRRSRARPTRSAGQTDFTYDLADGIEEGRAGGSHFRHDGALQRVRTVDGQKFNGACNSVQGATASLAFTATTAL